MNLLFNISSRQEKIIHAAFNISLMNKKMHARKDEEKSMKSMKIETRVL